MKQSINESQAHLGEVFGDDVRHGVDERGVVVGRGAAGDLLGAALLAHLVGVLDVELVQRLDVLVDEGDRDQHQVAVATLHHH